MKYESYQIKRWLLKIQESTVFASNSEKEKRFLKLPKLAMVMHALIPVLRALNVGEPRIQNETFHARVTSLRRLDVRYRLSAVPSWASKNRGLRREEQK